MLWINEFPEHDFPSILMQSGLRTSYIPHISGAAGRPVLMRSVRRQQLLGNQETTMRPVFWVEKTH